MVGKIILQLLCVTQYSKMCMSTMLMNFHREEREIDCGKGILCRRLSVIYSVTTY